MTIEPPKVSLKSESSRLHPRPVRWVLSISLALFLGSAYLAFRGGGGDLFIDRPERSMVGRPEGDPETFQFEVRNTTGHPIRIIGVDDRCTSDGGCSQTKPIPMTIPAGGSKSLEVFFKAGLSPYTFRLTAFTDDPDHPEIILTISG